MKKQRYNYGTYGFWFNKLPMSARMKARKNLANRFVKLTNRSINVGVKSVLEGSFIFSETPEGQNYWYKIADAVRCSNKQKLQHPYS